MARKFLHSIVTYQGGASYTIDRTRFLRNKPVKVTSYKTRQALSQKLGFFCKDTYEDDQNETPENVTAKVLTVDGPAPKRRGRKKKSVKRVNVDTVDVVGGDEQ